MKKILINATQKEELRVAIIDGKKLIDLDIDKLSSERKKGNIYKGKIARIEPGLDAVFVDYGEPKHGFLPFREISPAYYRNNPAEDRKGNESIAKSLRQGQSMLVQVQRENRENKGAALTTFISLAGRYLVLMPNSLRTGGVSRRIGDKDRNAMREMLSQLDTGDDKIGVIVRTQGVGRELHALQQDFDSLKKLWDSIVEIAKSRTAPFLIYQESNIAICALRDHFSGDIEDIMVDNEKIFNDARDFIHLVMPDQTEKLKLYQEPVPLFERFGIEDQIEAAFHRTITLPSGGSLVLDHTEALLSIDINSGRATKAGNIEETALNTNLEAAEEIALQLRLRDLGGLIIIDFIDMESATNRKAVEECLQKATRTDQARIQFGMISRFGLLEMSRQRLRPSLSESSHIPCPHCDGKGVIRSLESGALAALRMMEKEAIKETGSYIIAHLPIESATYLMNKKREKIKEIETRHDIKLIVIPDAHIQTPNIQVQKHITDNKHLQTSAKKHEPLTHQHYLTPDSQNSDSPIKTRSLAKNKRKQKPGFLSKLFSFSMLKTKDKKSSEIKQEREGSDRNRQRRTRNDNGEKNQRYANSRRKNNQQQSAQEGASSRGDMNKKSNNRNQRQNTNSRRRTTSQNKGATAKRRQFDNAADGNRHNKQTPGPRESENRTSFAPPMPELPKETPDVDKTRHAETTGSHENKKPEAYLPPDSSDVSNLTQIETKTTSDT